MTILIHRARDLLLATLLLLLTACTGYPARDEAAGSAPAGATFVVVRHAAKTGATERAPDLSVAGLELHL